ncbi:MAG TPA: M1 family metallopeptidase [Bryobacteraceae bacterium]|nr:M1 family metallopeptidase [Bryobacteraceae bacterium]
MRLRGWVLALCASVGFCDTYQRQPAIDVQHYVFRVELTDANDEVAGETTVSVRFLNDGVSSFWLDLASANAGKGMTVSEATSAGAAVRFEHSEDRLTLKFSPAAKSGDVRAFTVKYHGVPNKGLLFPKNKFGDRTMFSVNWPNLAHQWLPTVDHPSDKATSEFIVTAPDKYQVVANGLLQEEFDLGDGRRRTHWKQSVPIATWLNNIGVAEFASRHFTMAAGVPLQSWSFPKDRENGIATLEEPLRQSIEFFNDHIGPYAYEKLAGVEAAGMGGGMEHASEIFFGERSITGRNGLGLVSHETAHQWFGDSVTESDWDDVWLSEGFATYFSSLTTEHYLGRDAFVQQMQRTRPRIFQTEKQRPDTAVVDHKPWSGIPNQIVYQKGGWVLHMLRGQIGDETFWAAIREYYRRYRDSNATTADFEKTVEEISGQDLHWFFDQWIYRAGSPVVEAAWRYDAASKKVAIDLTQTENGAAYRLPMEIALQSASGPAKIEKVQFTGKQQHVDIAAEQEPASVELDPNVWLLIDAKIAKK